MPALPLISYDFMSLSISFPLISRITIPTHIIIVSIKREKVFRCVQEPTNVAIEMLMSIIGMIIIFDKMVILAQVFANSLKAVKMLRLSF